MITAARDHGRVLRYAFLSALADLGSIYTWRTWTLGWLVRLLCQVALFAFMGRLVGSDDVAAFLVVGNSVLVVAQAVLLTVSSTAWERTNGTLPLLVASPTALTTVFIGRNVQWILDGVTCGAVALFVFAPVFSVAIPLASALLALPALVLIAVSVYGFGLALGGLVLRRAQLRALVANVAVFLLMLFAGVQVPVSFWPQPVAVVSNVLPLTHGLTAIRLLFREDVHLSTVFVHLAAEAAVAAGWLLLAAHIFRRFADSGRKDGSIEFGL